METIKSRFSVNTSLKNARIFDEHSDDDSVSELIKKNNIKEEIEELAFNPFISRTSSDETKEEVSVETTIKQELFDEETNFPVCTAAFENIHIKKEVLEELTSPMKTDTYENSDSNSRKSLRSGKIFFSKKRDSPYKSTLERLGPSSSRIHKPNFDEFNKDTQRKKTNKYEMETDPIVLSRRQKQIDYGKNTLGYDEYCKNVPKSQRKPDDPQTPNKYLKYSRRGWDGLIKQWRLKLHKYDPEDS